MSTAVKQLSWSADCRSPTFACSEVDGSGPLGGLNFEIIKRPDVTDALLLSDQPGLQRSIPRHSNSVVASLSRTPLRHIDSQSPRHHAGGHSYLNIAERNVACLNCISVAFYSITTRWELLSPNEQLDLEGWMREFKNREVFESLFQHVSAAYSAQTVHSST